ncbi:MAG: bifunctional phosphoribosylaminoimidazolecarboxamide formyltransferase/IMP cyclohydrolase [Rhodothermia bacterium]|nr:MAG: bifunctional phosphoribosylaminoimidazolecarboxamide formyltransferase/IMP cyclohydrolase [Rhodothermia bacterium]
MISTKDLPAPDDLYPIRRALLSVFDKSGITDLGKALHGYGIELISTGGTARALTDAGLPVTEVSSITEFPEILDGRVKTLHPKIHGGLLARKTDADDLKQLADHGISPIDLVVVSLYPFEDAVSDPDITDAIAIENIDIGGPTMIRAAAKNYFFTAVVTHNRDYPELICELNKSQGSLSLTTRRNLATRAFERTGKYDNAVAEYFNRQSEEALSEHLSISAARVQSLRYGENPHQSAALYGDLNPFVEKIHGKELSFNNLLDLSAALCLIDEFSVAEPTCAILKHTNPCGVAMASDLPLAYEKAFSTDRQSPFGGIVVVNRALDMETAEAIDGVFTELIIAPEYEDGVLEFLQQKKNRRLLRHKSPARESVALDVRSVIGGYLVQERDLALPDTTTLKEQCRVVTERKPTDTEWLDLDFAWRVSKHVKSNAIVYALGGQTIGIGAGQMSRIDSSEVAVLKGGKSDLDFSNSVVASDAFFPFADGLLEAARCGAVAAIQPGGSVRDDEVIKAADENEIAMVFTGRRHFRH